MEAVDRQWEIASNNKERFWGRKWRDSEILCGDKGDTVKYGEGYKGEMEESVKDCEGDTENIVILACWDISEVKLGKLWLVGKL